VIRSASALRCAAWAGFAFCVLLTGCTRNRDVVADVAPDEPAAEVAETPGEVAEPQPEPRRRWSARGTGAELEQLRKENEALTTRVVALETALAEAQGNVNTLQAKLEAILSVPQVTDTTKPRVYRVREGDTLTSISEQPLIYNDARLWRRIYEANRASLPNPEALKPGQQLIIPR